MNQRSATTESSRAVCGTAPEARRGQEHGEGLIVCPRRIRCFAASTADFSPRIVCYELRFEVHELRGKDSLDGRVAPFQTTARAHHVGGLLEQTRAVA
jgi:hypothetical protein